MELLARRIARTGKVPELQAATARALRWATLGVVAMFCILALGIRTSDPRALTRLVRLSLTPVVVLVVLGAFDVRRAIRAARARGEPGLEGYGLVYRAPDDPRIWGPKVGAPGHTLNFAHWQAWLLLAVFVLPAAVALVLVLIALP